MPTEVNDLCSQASEELVKENYQRAIELYTEALSEEGRDDIYCRRAYAFQQQGKLEEALQDYDEALKLNKLNNKAYLKKGSILFQLSQVEKALQAFNEGLDHLPTDDVLKEWVERCQDALTRSKDTKDDVPALSIEKAKPPEIKHNWYQTHTHVVVAVMIKNLKEENFTLNVDDRRLKVVFKESGDSLATLDLILAHKVDPVQTSYKIYSTKVEIKLKKREGIQWLNLEGTLEEAREVLPASAVPVKTQETRSYPSSSHYTKNWDKLAAEVTEEEKSEKLEGDAALNQFFQNIYSDASDDTKKAMMKSFVESEGTVLSTNWDEVGSKRVEVKPPDGMEFKKWQM